MRTPEIISLPVSGIEYDADNEQSTRRTIELLVAALKNDMVEVRDKTDKPASLAMRRQQFLLMGAK